MKKLKLSLLLILTTLGLLTLSGCCTTDPSQSQLPWGRPASWENTTPGVTF